MTTRAAFTNLTNQARHPLAVKRMTRAAAMVSKGISNKKAMDTKQQGKENVVASLKVGKVPVTRPMRVAARRLSKPPSPVVKEDADDADLMELDVEIPSTEPQSSGIPAGCVDIDAEDRENPQLCAEYAPEIYAYLRSLEAGVGYTVRDDFLAGCPITGKMRAVLVDWLVEVQQQFRLLQETLFMTISIIDRYLAKEGKTIHRSQLQLVGVSAMFLAAKVEEIFAPEISDFVYITDNAYTGEEIRHMELRILSTLDFDLCRPISLNFLRRFSKAGDVDLLQHSVAKYVLEQGLLDYSMVSYQPSYMAAAALHLALLVTDGEKHGLWSRNLQYYSGYSSMQLMETVKKMASMIVKSETNKLQAVRTKYSSTKFMKVTSLPKVKSGMSRVCM